MVAADRPRCNIMSSSSAGRCAAAGKQSCSPGVSMAWQATHTVPSAPVASPGMLAVPLAACPCPCYPGPSVAAESPPVTAALGRGKHGTYSKQHLQVFKNKAIRIFVIQIVRVCIKCLISDSNVVWTSGMLNIGKALPPFLNIVL